MAEHKFDEEQRDRNLRLIQGGRAASAGQEPPVKDWLKPLLPDTVFLGKMKKDPHFFLVEYTVVRHFDNASCLWLEDMETVIHVHRNKFCKDVELIEVIREGNDE